MRYVNQLAEQIEKLAVTAKRVRPHWGARNIREPQVHRMACNVRIPIASTIYAALDRQMLPRRAPSVVHA
ncbi:hypothetical protein [Novosphingobium sp. FSW06-99]|uniref:hypothetical protein n=1 Tax=Novosphingobium sp. FSW06-99 TaxID=1739113 RepID=UPI00076D0194|nr:hypothetical protein [Novosphingobium sp. FSW06-99]KUR79044.1 hypothetical protein AQZ49_06425 [Novosphingobium sp. FSW06-99]